MNKEYKTLEELKEELGDKFEEFMYKANIELLDKVNQLETNRDKAIKYIEQTKYYRDDQIFVDILHPYLDKLLEILERGKE